MINKRLMVSDLPDSHIIIHDYLFNCIFRIIIITGLSVLLICGCDPGSILSPRQWNYVVVDYHDGNIIFYSSSKKSMTTLPDRLTGIMVLKYNRDESMYDSEWVIDGAPHMCGNHESAYNLAKVVYGDTPKCYKTRVKGDAIILNEKYKVKGCVPNNEFEDVTFRLIKCKNKNGICLETNSPVSLLDRLR